VYTREFVIMIN